MKRGSFTLLLLLIGLVLFFLKSSGYPFLHGYPADLISIPLILLVAERGMQFFYRKDFTTGRTHVLLTTLFVIVLFEVILPGYAPDIYTADLWDVLCYLTGAALFILWM